MCSFDMTIMTLREFLILSKLLRLTERNDTIRNIVLSYWSWGWNVERKTNLFTWDSQWSGHPRYSDWHLRHLHQPLAWHSYVLYCWRVVNIGKILRVINNSAARCTQLYTDGQNKISGVLKIQPSLFIVSFSFLKHINIQTFYYFEKPIKMFCNQFSSDCSPCCKVANWVIITLPSSALSANLEVGGPSLTESPQTDAGTSPGQSISILRSEDFIWSWWWLDIAHP